MMKFIIRFLVALVLVCFSMPNDNDAQAGRVLLTMPPILASPNIIEAPPPPPPVTMICNGREWQLKDNGNKYCNVGDSIGSCSYDARKYCQDLQLGGYLDWYLPSRSELQDLATCSNKLLLPEGAFWSSSRDYSYPSFASPHYFVVVLPSGDSNYHDPTGLIGDGQTYVDLLKVLCIR